MAREFGLPLSAVMAMPHHVFRAHVAWLDLQWEEPTKTEWYLMQLAAMWSSSGRVERFKMRFAKKVGPDQTSSAEVERIKAAKFAQVGYVPPGSNAPQPGNLSAG